MQSKAKAAIVGAMIWVSTGCTAQNQMVNIEVPGNLAATQNPGCIAIAQAGPELTPPDLQKGALECAAAKDWDGMRDLFLLGQVRAAFDTRRVADQTAHQAVPALALQFNKALSPKARAEFEAAFGRFGGTGSPAHDAFCTTLWAMDPPDYTLTYMTAHGMDAVMGRKSIPVEPFAPTKAWDETLRGYLKCSG